MFAQKGTILQEFIQTTKIATRRWLLQSVDDEFGVERGGMKDTTRQKLGAKRETKLRFVISRVIAPVCMRYNNNNIPTPPSLPTLHTINEREAVKRRVLEARDIPNAIVLGGRQTGVQKKDNSTISLDSNRF